MKTYTLIIFLILALSNNLFSTNCIITTECENEEFPYIFCNSNNLITRCSKNPYNEYDGNTKLKPMKLNGCFNYISSSYKIIYETVEHHTTVITHHWTIINQDPDGYDYYGFYGDEPIYYPNTENEIDGYSYGDYIYEEYDTHIDHVSYSQEPCNETYTNFLGNIAFNYYDIQSDFSNALSAWTNNCSGCTLNNQDIQSCCVPVSWTEDRREFLIFSTVGTEDGPTKISAYAHQEINPGSSFPCEYDCSKLYIHMNQTYDFTGATASDPCDYSNHFFLTGNASKTGWYSLTATIMHEMGHLFGFGDEYTGIGTSCAHTGSIMEDTDFDQTNRGLSDKDACMYMKMYCWSPILDVQDISIDFVSINMYPNPTNTDFITIKVNDDNMNCILNYTIYALEGMELIKGNFDALNNKEKKIELNELSSGSYVIKLNCNNNLFVKRFVKLK